MKKDACTSRLTMLPADRNLDSCTWKTTTIRTRPARMGRTPLSPLRIRTIQARRYSPSELARTSGAAAISCADGS
jgi:hypothetical protein